MTTPKTPEELAREIVAHHCTPWAYCMEEVKCIGAPVSVHRLFDAIVAAIRDARSIEALLPSEEQCAQKAVEICNAEPERVTQVTACQYATRKFYEWLRTELLARAQGSKK